MSSTNFDLALAIGGSATPRYVVRIEPETRRIVIGPRDALATRTVCVSGVNWLGGAVEPGREIECEVKLRNTMAPVAARLKLDRDGGAVVELAGPEFGVSPGQACVFYDGDRVLGGGWIARAADARAA